MRFRDIDEVRELVRAEAPLEEVVPRFGVRLRGVGTTHHKALCPFHEEKEPSFSINVAKQLWYCHGCKRGGDVFSFVQMKECVGHVEAIEIVAGLVEFPLSPYRRDLTPEERRQQELYGINAGAHAQMESAFVHPWAQERAFDPETLQIYGVAHVDHVGQLELDVSSNDRKRLQFGWKAKWADAIVIPLRDARGQIAGFRCRTDGGRGRPLGPDEHHPLPVPPVYGLFEARSAIRETGYAIVVEGEADVWQMVGRGYGHTVGMMGTKFGEDEARYLWEHGVCAVVVMPDGDKAGRKFARQLAETHLSVPISIKIARLEDGDPDEVLLREPDEVREALEDAVYSFEYLIRHVLSGAVMESITDKVDALAELRPYFATSAAYERDLAVRELASRLGMAPEAVDDYFREPAEGEPVQLANVRGERIILAGMLMDEHFAGEALLSLASPAFHLPKHRRLFDVLAHLFTTQEELSPEVVATHLRNRGDERLAVYVWQVADADDPPSRSFVLGDVKDKATRRIVRAQAQDVIARLGDLSTDAHVLIQGMSASLAHAVMGQTNAMRGLDEVVREHMVTVMERFRNPSLIVGLDLGPDWERINLALRGLQRRRLIVVEAPTTVGKTAIAGCWYKIATVDRREPALYCTFETGDDVLFERIVANMSGVESDKIVTGYMTPEELERVQDAAATLAAAPGVITRRGRSKQELFALIRHDVLTRGTRIVFVDYAQLMYVDGWPTGRRDLELGDISAGLLELANELDITIVLLAQINREGTKKSNAGGAPRMEDTGDSIRIPQDADVVVIFRFKTEGEVDNDGIQMGNRSGWIDKNRGGRRGIGVSIIADESTSHYREAKDDPAVRGTAGERQEHGREDGGRRAGLPVRRRRGSGAGAGGDRHGDRHRARQW